jgi:hypothetical protein
MQLLKDKSIKEGSNSSSNISGPSMDCYPQCRPVTQQSEGTVYNRKLYMHQIFDGPDYNQVNIADLGQPQMFGCTNVHDYPIYDSLDPNAKIVARAQGLHTETCLDYDNWFQWSRLVFSDERFVLRYLILILIYLNFPFYNISAFSALLSHLLSLIKILILYPIDSCHGYMHTTCHRTCFFV